MTSDPTQDEPDFQLRIPQTDQVQHKQRPKLPHQPSKKLSHELKQTLSDPSIAFNPRGQALDSTHAAHVQWQQQQVSESLKRPASGEDDGSTLSRAESPHKKLRDSPAPSQPPIPYASVRATHAPSHLARSTGAARAARQAAYQQARPPSTPGQIPPVPASRPEPPASALRNPHEQPQSRSALDANAGPQFPASAHGPDQKPAGMRKEPPSQEITQKQLAQEITAIYKALVQIEQKAVQLVGNEFAKLRKSSADAVPQKDSDHWQALIALHRTLLHEHHDFFLASQHPSSGKALREIATKYSMPARMWKHGIHNFLELLRRHLPHSMEFMLAFIYLAYQMIALLYETVAGYEETWIECLGDLARYRMAIEEDDLRDREIWTGVARMWYCKAVDCNPGVGRLQHHLAILARTNAVEQLSLYARSLAAEQPFASTRASIMTLLEPMLARQENVRQLSVDTWFVKVHGVIFTNGPEDLFEHALGNFTTLLNSSLERLSSRWRLQGAFIAICNIVSATGWGQKSPSRDILLEDYPLETSVQSEDSTTGPALHTAESASDLSLARAHKVLIVTIEIVLSHAHDANILNFVFLTLTFIISVSRKGQGYRYFSSRVMWERLAGLLNQTMSLDVDFVKTNPFEVENAAPLPEEFLSNGQLWSRGVAKPANWLQRSVHEEDERKIDKDEALHRRRHRIVAMGKDLAQLASDDMIWLRFANDVQQFVAGTVASPVQIPDAAVGKGQQMEIVSGRTKRQEVVEPVIVKEEQLNFID